MKNSPLDINIVLIAPEIPFNTGSIGRVCVCTGARLHLIEPLGFSLSEANVRRAGLDYWEHVELALYSHWEDFLEREKPPKIFFASTEGQKSYYQYAFASGDYLVFGNETSGLPAPFYERYKNQLYQIPMPGEHSRTLNLANAASIITYEALRQIQYAPSISQQGESE